MRKGKRIAERYEQTTLGIFQLCGFRFSSQFLRFDFSQP